MKHLRGQVGVDGEFKNIVGRSKPMKNLFRLIRLVASSSSTILIQGESGTGKELVARAIHHRSPRRHKPFVAIDCGALPDPLLESELFGHVRGAFTGAVNNKKGLFEEAHGGTLFLDEIGDTTLALQSRLLRVLQENEVRPVGGNKSIRMDVRIIVATNKDLKEEVKKGNFREDLFYRLVVVPLMIPPLRQRRDDIPVLVDHFIKKHCERNRLELKQVSTEALKLLSDCPWPGNVRELEHMIERAVLLSRGPEIDPKTFFLDLVIPDGDSQLLQQTIKVTRDAVEKAKIMEVLQRVGGTRSQAARLLGISRTTLYDKLKRYRITG